MAVLVYKLKTSFCYKLENHFVTSNGYEEFFLIISFIQNHNLPVNCDVLFYLVRYKGLNCFLYSETSVWARYWARHSLRRICQGEIAIKIKDWYILNADSKNQQNSRGNRNVDDEAPVRVQEGKKKVERT